MISTTRTKTLCDAFSMLHSLARGVAQQIHLQLESEALDSPEDARAALTEVETRLLAIAQEARRDLERFEGSESMHRETLTAVLGTAAGWIEGMRGQEVVSRWLRDDIGALGLIRAQMRMVEVIARELGDAATAEAKRREIADLERAALRLDELLPRVLEVELRDAGKTLTPPEVH